jgi:hypothetical protein
MLEFFDTSSHLVGVGLMTGERLPDSTLLVEEVLLGEDSLFSIADADGAKPPAFHG